MSSWDTIKTQELIGAKDGKVVLSSSFGMRLNVTYCVMEDSPVISIMTSSIPKGTSAPCSTHNIQLIM